MYPQTWASAQTGWAKLAPRQRPPDLSANKMGAFKERCFPVTMLRLRLASGNLNTPRRAFRRRHEGECSLTQRRWLLRSSLTRDHQRAEGCCAAFPKLTANGQPLDLTFTLDEAGLRDGDVVDAVVQLPKLASTSGVSAWRHEAVAWGLPNDGGDSSQAQEQLRDVQHIQAMVILLPFLNLGLL